MIDPMADLSRAERRALHMHYLTTYWKSHYRNEKWEVTESEFLFSFPANRQCELCDKAFKIFSQHNSLNHMVCWRKSENETWNLGNLIWLCRECRDNVRKYRRVIPLYFHYLTGDLESYKKSQVNQMNSTSSPNPTSDLVSSGTEETGKASK